MVSCVHVNILMVGLFDPLTAESSDGVSDLLLKSLSKIKVAQ